VTRRVNATLSGLVASRVAQLNAKIDLVHHTTGEIAQNAASSHDQDAVRDR
jgi:hypothetical protein